MIALRLTLVLGALVWATSCGSSQATTPATATTPEVTGAAPREPAQPRIVERPPHRTTGMRRPASAKERQTIEMLARASEAVRDLRFRRPVRVEIEDDLAISQSLMEEIKDEDVEKAKVVYTALGLLERHIDLRKMFEELLAEQVVGYYDPTDHRLVVRNDVMASLSSSVSSERARENQLTIIHELVHALQDQRLGLGPANEKKRTADADNAFRAAIEGDATLAMVGHLVAQQGLPMQVVTASIQQMGEVISTDALISGDKLKEAPAIVRVTLLAPYLNGLQFIAAVYNHGGWRAVDRAHARPPTTTEQVLHPAKFFAHEKGERVRLPAMSQLQRAGWRRLEEDTLGELELGVYFGQLMASGVDERAAAGWAGDRLRVYENGDRSAVVWFTSWDSDRDAIEAEEAARRVSPGRQGDRVIRRGRGLLMIRDLPIDLHEPVLRAFEAFARKLGRPPQSS